MHNMHHQRNHVPMLLALCLLSLFSVTSSVSPPAYARPLAYTYADGGGPTGINSVYNTTKMLSYWADNKVTALTPFIHNANASPYDGFIQQVKNQGISIIPCIGRPPGDSDNVTTTIDQPNFKNFATSYAQYTTFIRIENAPGYYTNNKTSFMEMMQFLANLNFTRIVLNPWPIYNGQGAIPFSVPGVTFDAYEAITLGFNRSDPSYPIYQPPSPTNWFPNCKRITQILANQSTAEFFINYEEVPQQAALNMSVGAQPQGSEDAMNTTVTQILTGNCSQYASVIHWNPPFSSIYDPIGFRTWAYIKVLYRKLTGPM